MSDRVEVLIAALDCNPESLIDKMNIQTDELSPINVTKIGFMTLMRTNIVLKF